VEDLLLVPKRGVGLVDVASTEWMCRVRQTWHRVEVVVDAVSRLVNVLLWRWLLLVMLLSWAFPMGSMA
jgi:hypothetical protein